VPHDLGGFEVDGILVGEAVLFVAGDEGEGVDVFVELGEREFEGMDRSTSVCCSGCCGWGQRRFGLGFEVVEGDAGEVGDDDIARGFLGAAFVEQILEVLEGLGLGLAEVLAEALVLD